VLFSDRFIDRGQTGALILGLSVLGALGECVGGAPPRASQCRLYGLGTGGDVYSCETGHADEIVQISLPDGALWTVRIKVIIRFFLTLELVGSIWFTK
jgi:hypothetical protein